MKFLLDAQQTERLIFRPIQASDFEKWLPFFQDPNTSIHWKEERQSPELACRQWYEKQFWRYENNLGGMNALIEKESGRLAGHAGLIVQTVDDKIELEIAYSLHPEFWGKGYATEAAARCRDFAFQNYFSESLISIISKTNVPSQNVATRVGMQREKQTIYKGNEVYIFRINATNR